MSGVLSLFITLIWLMYQSDYRTALTLVSYTAPINNDSDVIRSGKLVYQFGNEIRGPSKKALERYFGNVQVSLPKMNSTFLNRSSTKLCSNEHLNIV